MGHAGGQLLVQMALSSCTDAMAISFFIRSTQEAAPRTARSLLEVLDALVFGTPCPNGNANRLEHTHSTPDLSMADGGGPREEQLLGEQASSPLPPLDKADAVGTSRSSSAATHGTGEEAEGGAGARKARGQHLTHSHSMPCVTHPAHLDAAGLEAARPGHGAGAGQEASGWQSDSGQGGSGGAKAAAGGGGGGGRRASSSGGGGGDMAEDDLMGLCQQHSCTWTRLTEAKDRRGLLMKSRKLMRVLREIGNKLVEVSPALRQRELQCALERVNDRLPAGIYIPLLQGRYPLFYILSLLPNEARVFSTNKRAPFLCVAEIDAVQARPGVRESEGGPAEPSCPSPASQGWRWSLSRVCACVRVLPACVLACGRVRVGALPSMARAGETAEVVGWREARLTRVRCNRVAPWDRA